MCSVIILNYLFVKRPNSKNLTRVQFINIELLIKNSTITYEYSHICKSILTVIIEQCTFFSDCNIISHLGIVLPVLFRVNETYSFLRLMYLEIWDLFDAFYEHWQSLCEASNMLCETWLTWLCWVFHSKRHV